MFVLEPRNGGINVELAHAVFYDIASSIRQIDSEDHIGTKLERVDVRCGKLDEFDLIL